MNQCTTRHDTPLVSKTFDFSRYLVFGIWYLVFGIAMEYRLHLAPPCRVPGLRGSRCPNFQLTTRLIRGTDHATSRDYSLHIQLHRVDSPWITPCQCQFPIPSQNPVLSFLAHDDQDQVQDQVQDQSRKLRPMPCANRPCATERAIGNLVALISRFYQLPLHRVFVPRQQATRYP